MTAPRFEPGRPSRGPVVRGYADGGFSVDGEIHPALMLTPLWARGWASPPPLGELAIDHLEPVLGIDPAPEFVLLGTGGAMAFAPRGLVAALEARGIGLEAMDSRAAARTWSVLRTEERWIAAVLLPL